jgi:hypothetical protein
MNENKAKLDFNEAQQIDREIKHMTDRLSFEAEKENRMNHTKSGAIAVGRPMSKARILNEAKYALDVDFKRLWATEEGAYIRTVFQQVSNMDESEIKYNEYMYAFIGGILFCDSL